MQVQQKGRVFYLVSASAVDLDRLCSVPVIRYETPNSEVAQDALAAYITRWQRELDVDRIREIAKFFSAPNNLLVNSALIGVKNNVVFHTNAAQRSVATIPVNWIRKQCPVCQWTPPDTHPHRGEAFDACSECTWDGRPGQIIDGQHRVRGCAAAGSAHWSERLVASVLVEGQFSSMEEAKIFTEITTSAVDLHELHKIYLLFKFGLRSAEVGALKDADFRPGLPAGGAPNTLGTRHRRGYEVACNLVSTNGSRWFDRISMFPGPNGRARKGDVVDADVLVSFCESWLRTGPLVDASQADAMVPSKVAADRLRDFLEATLATWPAGVGTPLGGSSSFWNDGRAKIGWLQLRGIFEVFLSVFEITSRRLQSHGVPPSAASYREELSYIEPINWDDPAWHELAAPDKNKYLLRRILEHLYSNAPFPVGGARAPTRLNSWIREKPDGVQFTVQPPAASPVATVSAASPLKFSWDSTSPFSPGRVPKPVNAYDTAVILIEQDQRGGKTEILDQAETILTTYSLISPPDSLDSSPGAAPVRITVSYSNPNGTTTASLTHPAV